MAHHLAKPPEPVSTGDASREEAITAGLSLKARTQLISLLGDFLNVAANRDLLCPEFESGCCPSIPLEPLNRLFFQLRKAEATASMSSGGSTRSGPRPPPS